MHNLDSDPDLWPSFQLKICTPLYLSAKMFTLNLFSGILVFELNAGTGRTRAWQTDRQTCSFNIQLCRDNNAKFMPGPCEEIILVRQRTSLFY